MTASPPLVSVVMPVHNAGDFLQLSMSSALKQSLGAIELICVDDGSTDDSPAMLESAASVDARVRVIVLPENRGEAAARNVGLDAASADYVFCLDADDELPPMALERLLSAARSRGCELAMGRLDWLRDTTDEAQAPSPPERPLHVTVADVRNSPVLQSVPGCHCCNLYSRRLLERHHIRYEDDLSIGGDQLFQATAIVLAGRVAMIDEIVYIYHHYRGSSVTRRPPELRSLLDDVEYQCRISRLFTAFGLHDAGISRLTNWVYSIREYWVHLPTYLKESEAAQFFGEFRAMTTDFGIVPWDERTPAHYRRLLALIMEGEDEMAFTFLANGRAGGTGLEVF